MAKLAFNYRLENCMSHTQGVIHLGFLTPGFFRDPFCYQVTQKGKAVCFLCNSQLLCTKLFHLVTLAEG